ncbi:pilus assembly protein N-terminal domain-containing protein [Blastopirellula sp. JC732]|uniref:Pilus assembly protein N-terminal domain-containing protein n=1 Tax=Blastopirellula sediminis TaxID=2894196 RepID=A0A9X1MRS0_9BACT|nr:pilus assembly protein N-terminal domain-containing protein [Blastopirellula sediminis]MCC9605423.1 pilus assembly protein N-terminal domain-containing protein [Blastopirellula sediminis]MCC9631277.1 pilus assembly protein N-terminal domain-containing protein [Blastopirellula sediminis]
MTMRNINSAFATLAILLCLGGFAFGQAQELLPAPNQIEQLSNPKAESLQKQSNLIDEVLEPELIFTLLESQSKIIRTKAPVFRIAITNPTLVEVNEFSPNELEVIGSQAGQTTMTLWFNNPDGTVSTLRYLIIVTNEDDRAELEYGKLQARINELFPYSRVQLFPIADKLIIRGQARDAKEAAEILAVVGEQTVNQNGNITNGGAVNVGSVARLPNANDLETTSLINLLEVPGEQQVMLKVRVAELSREAARELGMDFSVMEESFSIAHTIMGGAGNLSAILDGGDVELFIRAFSSNGTAKILAEPTLMTLSGQSASFIAGGEFAVPTAVGVGGIGAVSTSFRGFGTQVSFTPTVTDKDMIRLSVAPSVSSVNENLTVDGVPGLDIRGAVTTVDLREGQWLAIAGLIQDEQEATRSRFPLLGDIPYVGAAFGSQSTKRIETELVILVSPELVHPMERDQVPLYLPGMEVTEPTDKEFFLHQQIEGLPGYDFRSTVWPTYRHQIHHQNFEQVRLQREARKCRGQYQESEGYYVHGPAGFSD